MKILVTGSSGFIGEYIVKNLSKKNEVIATCYKIKKEKKIKKIKYIKFNKDTLKNTNNIDAIVHCAASTPPKYSQLQCYKNNKIIDDLIFTFAKKKRIRKLIYFSSMSIYGKKKK